MADRYYGAAVGASLPKDITESGSTNSTAIELRVTTGTDVRAVLLALEAIEYYISSREKQAIE